MTPLLNSIIITMLCSKCRLNEVCSLIDACFKMFFHPTTEARLTGGLAAVTVVLGIFVICIVIFICLICLVVYYKKVKAQGN